MYRAIVRRKIRFMFDAVSRGDAGPVIDGFAATFEHRFLGEDHALGGSRTSREKIVEWYARLYRLLPDIRFDLERIEISGPPWNTIAVVDWKEENSGTDGVRTSNRGCHIVHIAWGRMTRLLICPDTAGLVATLNRLAEAGVAEAMARPITD